MNVLVTGCAGFIGYHTCVGLAKHNKIQVFGIDNLNSYYDTNLKKNRIFILKKYKNFKFTKLDISKYKKLNEKKQYSEIHIIVIGKLKIMNCL